MLDSKHKLFPLRKFVVNGGYSKEYLSQLVQRKTLKAKKVGRNYFTTIDWFEQYLEFYSRDGKSEQIKKNLYQSLGYVEPVSRLKPIASPEIQKLTPNSEVGFLLPAGSTLRPAQGRQGSLQAMSLPAVNKLSFVKYILAATLGMAVILFLWNMYMGSSATVAEKGRFGQLTTGMVSGVSEAIPVGNAGELQNEYLQVHNSLYKVFDSVSSSGKSELMLEEVER